MRVQPDLPSSPLTAIVTSRSGLARFACSAANRPAPPAPSIRMSVSSWFIAPRLFQRADACENLVTARCGGRIDLAVQRAAVRIHRDQQRAETADAEFPQALRIELLEI